MGPTAKSARARAASIYRGYTLICPLCLAPWRHLGIGNSRKERLTKLLRRRSSSLIYVDHLLEYGTILFNLPCRQDLEGIVAKRTDHPYPTEGKKPLWVKFKKPVTVKRKVGASGLIMPNGGIQATPPVGRSGHQLP